MTVVRSTRRASHDGEALRLDGPLVASDPSPDRRSDEMLNFIAQQAQKGEPLSANFM